MLKQSYILLFITLLAPLLGLGMESNQESEAEEICLICLDLAPERNDSDFYRTKCCELIFHTKCIEKWLSIKPRCPHCQSEIPKSLFRKIIGYIVASLSTEEDHDLATNHVLLSLRLN